MSKDAQEEPREGVAGIPFGLQSQKALVDIVVGPRERTLTEKGKSYQLELRNQKQTAIYGQLTREIERVSLLLKQLSKEELERIRDTLDSLKGQFNEAHRAYEELLDSDEEKRSSYIWFDSRDREFMDFRMRICQQILRLEFEKNAVVSVHSVPHSAISRRSKGSSASSHARRIEVKARSARLKAEKEFFDREIEYKRFYLEKEIAINAAEEAVLDQLVMEENTEVKAGEMCSPKNKTAEDPVVKFENMASKLEPEPFLENPSGYTIRQSEVQSEILFIERLINIQDKQMELTAQIANQQRINSLPVQEPPVFSGNTFDYPAFVTAFDAIILNNVKKESDKLYFLNKYTAGKANEIVKGFLSLPENGYSMARKILDQRFGNPIKIGEAFKVRLRNWPQINDGNSAALQDFADFLVRCEEAMRISDAMAELNSSQILKESCAKLPSYSCIKWCRQAHDRQKNLKKQVKFHDFVIFVKEEAELATDPIFSPDALKSLRKNALDSRNINKKQLTGKPVNRVSLKTESKPLQNDMIEKRSPSFSCFLCKNNSHSLEKCSKFIKKNMDERRDFVRVNHLCFGCFSNDGHISKNCQNRLLCEECGKRHPTPLHYSSAPVKSEDSSKTKEALKPSDGKANSNAVAVCSNQDRSTVVTNCMILPVLLSHKEIPEKVVQVYAILDEASDTTFVKTSVMHDLGIEGTKTSLQLNTMLGREQIDVNRIEGLIVKRLDEQVEIELPKTYSRDNIPSRRDQIPTPDIADKWKHLKKIKDKLLPYQKDTEVGLLIGCNCPRALKPKEVILGKSEEPYAVRSILGWGIIGPVGVANEDNLQASCNRIVAQESVNSCDTLSFMLQANSKEIIDPVIVSKFFEQDFSESKDHSTLGLSHEDRLFLKIVEQGISHKDNGHYELPLPFKTPNLLLPDNRHIVLRHLMRLKHKFASDPKYKEEYVDFMEKMISNGYAEKIPNGQQEEGKVGHIWRIPHHGVRHPKKNTIRCVFNCAHEFMGESLNKHLLQGPDLTNNLVGVLCRFRKEPVAFTCDIESMFYQVKVAEDDRDYLRFLWWEKGDTSKAPIEYRMTVHLFGAVSSPGCANFALKKTAEDNKDQFGTAAAQFVQQDFYVDDGLKSCQSVKEAKDLIVSVKEMCKRGGFKLHKFISNSREVIRDIPEEDRGKELKALNLDLDSLPLERTLGVEWCIESDSFQFRIHFQDKPCTRRGILSTVSSIFDPLGLVAPLLLEGKSVLQELCREKVAWDDPVPIEIKARWQKWRQDLLKLEKISVPRCYKPSDFGSSTEIQLHHFADASNKGYGQCSYLRLRNEKGSIHCSLVFGKSRVKPLKQITIPRLELTAATVSVKTSHQIRKELDFDEVQETFWTDSRVVLGYIANESKRFHTFVANRVQQIQDHTDKKQWRYVSSQVNPADHASRGLKVEEFQFSSWLTGPKFLWENESCWSCEKQPCNSYQELDINDPNVKKVVTMTTNSELVQPCKDLICQLKNISSWYRAKRVVALCIKFVTLCRNKVKESPKQIKIDLSVCDIEAAEKVIIKAIQTKAFQQEITALSTGKMVSKSSVLLKLNPQIDSDGVLRANGRLKYAQLPEEQKFPALLPKESHVTTLVIRHFHEKIEHQGRGMTLNEIRACGFWIVGGSNAVGKLIGKCVTCRKLRAPVKEQIMATLPEDRLAITPPFTNSAVDYFGPWIIKLGRKEVKRYGVLFTCLASRAIHLETATSLETDSFINALRRFICRRGPIRQLRSDQGTNFVGARRELKQALDEMDHEKVKSHLLKENCDWFEFKMNVPTASHMGGVWERQIKSVRTVLDSLLRKNGAQLDDESLRTLMCEAEAIVNGRPLTVDPLNDPDSLTPLTPNHILTMKSKIVLSPPGVFQHADKYCRSRWRRVQHLANEFWCRWRKEYLLSLQQRQKWTNLRRNVSLNDIVIIKDENAARSQWQLARVVAIYPSSDGCIRKVQLTIGDRFMDNAGKRKNPLRILERPIQKLVVLLHGDVS